MGKKLEFAAIAEESGCNYPPPFDAPCLGSSWRRLGRSAGLTAFGVNISRIPPSVWSSQRHWHSHEDEFVMVLEGELTLVTDAGEELLKAGDCAAFKAGDPDGHHLVNRSGADALVLEVGNSDPAHDRCDYSDIDMVAEPGIKAYLHRDGSAYPLNEG
jgi:uncharacterized cupin superfamily protein